MPKQKTNSRLGEIEAQKRASERQEQRSRRWQQVVIIAISVIVLASMVIGLFVR